MWEASGQVYPRFLVATHCSVLTSGFKTQTTLNRSQSNAIAEALMSSIPSNRMAARILAFEKKPLSRRLAQLLGYSSPHPHPKNINKSVCCLRPSPTAAPSLPCCGWCWGWSGWVSVYVCVWEEWTCWVVNWTFSIHSLQQYNRWGSTSARSESRLQRNKHACTHTWTFSCFSLQVAACFWKKAEHSLPSRTLASDVFSHHTCVFWIPTSNMCISGLCKHFLHGVLVLIGRFQQRESVCVCNSLEKG